jgi:tRNA uridine 5-carboxymethylaminomethyl modification enzyme
LIGWIPQLAAVAPDALEQVIYDVKYAGYVDRQQVEIDRQQRLQEKRFPANFDFGRITHLRAEAREKLSRIRPTNLAQASRVSGITPADVALLLIHLGGK